MRLIITLATLLCSTAALANGGPVDWTEATPIGSIVPTRATSAVVLHGESLRLAIDADMEHATADARYTLENTSPEPVTVTYGVPVTWADDHWEERHGHRHAVPDAVHIQLGDATYRCTLAESTLDMPALPELESESAPLTVKQWCVTEISVPEGRSELRLRYRMALWFEDVEVSKSPLTFFGMRYLHYPLFPATAWTLADDARADITLDLGPFSSLDGPDAIRAPGATRHEHTLRWDALPLASTEAVFASFVAEPLLLERQIHHWNRDASEWTRIALETPNAKGLLDGELDTVWKPKKGKAHVQIRRAHVEVTDDDPTVILPPNGYGGCRLHALSLVSPSASAACNGFTPPTQVTLSACGAPSASADAASVTTPLDWQQSYILVSPFDSGLDTHFILDRPDACIELTFPKDTPICLPEASVIVNCG